MESDPSLLLFSLPLQPGLKLKLKPVPYSINPLDQKERFFSVLLGGPLSVVMGLQI